MSQQPTTQQVIEWILQRVTLDSPSAPLRKLVFEAFRNLRPEADELDLLQWRDESLNSVREALSVRYNREVESGIPRFELIGNPPEYIKGSAVEMPTDTDSLRKQRRMLSLAGDVRSALQHLSAEQFEALCCLVQIKLGAKDFQITGKTGDGGIDFLAKFCIFELKQAVISVPRWVERLESQSMVVVVGQAKRWFDRPVQPCHLRELIGASILYQLESGESMPRAVSIFMTAGTFTRGALEIGRRAGIITLDGQWLITALLYFGIGVTCFADTPAFDETAFLRQVDTMLGRY
jgi:hypothetical protein